MTKKKKKNKKKKYTTSIINGVRVTSATKREFWSNVEFYKEQGIRSSQALQKQRNITSKIRKAERETQNAAIREAYNKEKEKMETLGYSLQFFINVNKKIQKRAAALQLTAEKKIILPVGKPVFPITDGKINLNRLNKTLKSMSRSVNSIKKAQSETVLNNISEVFYGYVESFKFFKSLYHSIKNKDEFYIYIDGTIGDKYYRYDIRDFREDERERFWYGDRSRTHAFDNFIVKMADYLGREDVLKWFGI